MTDNLFRTEAARVMSDELDRIVMRQIARTAEMWAESLEATARQVQSRHPAAACDFRDDADTFRQLARMPWPQRPEPVQDRKG